MASAFKMRTSTVRGGDALRYILTVVPVSGTDAGTISEITSLVARETVPVAEAGTISETALVTVKTTTTDVNAVTAESASTVQVVQVSASDSGTAVEAVASIRLSASDVNGFSEIATPKAVASTTDANGALTYNLQTLGGNLITTPFQTNTSTSGVYVMILSFRYGFN